MKVAFHTLGCKVNQYESEMLSEKFRSRGYEIVGEEDAADIYVVNTCTVTALADRKSRQYIRRMKKKNPESIVAVIGCSVQVNPENVCAIEGVNILAGTNEKAYIVEHIEAYIEKMRDVSLSANAKTCVESSCSEADARKKYRGFKAAYIKKYEELTEYESIGLVTDASERTRAYVKIEEGCNRFCTYCIIPYVRGAVRSRPEKDIIREAEVLIAKARKEIVLTGINTALYGSETDGKLRLDELLSKLDDLKGDFRIRLSSLEPTVVDAEYVTKLFKFNKLCHHLHLSLQSGSDAILKSMGRRYDRRDYFDIVNVLKNFDPNYGITTDIIAGFPGETDADAADSIDMIEKVNFCRVHPFKFSIRPGTVASKMEKQIPSPVKKKRVNMLLKAGERSAQKFFEANVGSVRTVLIEEYVEDKKCFTGYTDNYIKVYIPGESRSIDMNTGNKHKSNIGNSAEKNAEHSRMISKNRFYDVSLVRPFEDGMLGEV